MDNNSYLQERNKGEHHMYVQEGKLKYVLARFGDHIAEREGYKEHDGLDAVHFYLCQKYHWPPTQVFAMTSSHLRFLLAEEMHNWTLPKEAIC